MNFSTIILSSPVFPNPIYPALWTPRRGEKSCRVPGRQCGVIKLQVINDICRTIACDCAVIISIVCSTLSAALCLALSQPWLIDIKQATHTFLIPVDLHPAAGVIRPRVSGFIPTLHTSSEEGFNIWTIEVFGLLIWIWNWTCSPHHNKIWWDQHHISDQWQLQLTLNLLTTSITL